MQPGASQYPRNRQFAHRRAEGLELLDDKAYGARETPCSTANRTYVFQALGGGIVGVCWPLVIVSPRSCRGYDKRGWACESVEARQA